MAERKGGLGRGLAALIPSAPADIDKNGKTPASAATPPTSSLASKTRTLVLALRRRVRRRGRRGL